MLGTICVQSRVKPPGTLIRFSTLMMLEHDHRVDKKTLDAFFLTASGTPIHRQEFRLFNRIIQSFSLVHISVVFVPLAIVLKSDHTEHFNSNYHNCFSIWNKYISHTYVVWVSE